jgi:hypothetical protein
VNWLKHKWKQPRIRTSRHAESVAEIVAATSVVVVLTALRVVSAPHVHRKIVLVEETVVHDQQATHAKLAIDPSVHHAQQEIVQ